MSVNNFLNFARNYDNILWGIGVVGTLVIFWLQAMRKKKKSEKSKLTQSHQEKYDY